MPEMPPFFDCDKKAKQEAQKRADTDGFAWSVLIDTFDNRFYIRPSAEVEVDEVTWADCKPRPFPTPECDKLAEHQEAYFAINQFLEWLREHENCVEAIMRSDAACTDALYAYFGIDKNKIEKERREILARMAQAEQVADEAQRD